MLLWQNIPMFLVVGSLASAAVCSVLPNRIARAWLVCAAGTACAASAFFLGKMLGYEGGSYVYKMGEFGAPYGNELLCGVMEAVVALLFTTVLFLSVLGGWRKGKQDVDGVRRNLFCTGDAAAASGADCYDVYQRHVHRLRVYRNHHDCSVCTHLRQEPRAHDVRRHAVYDHEPHRQRPFPLWAVHALLPDGPSALPADEGGGG